MHNKQLTKLTCYRLAICGRLVGLVELHARARPHHTLIGSLRACMCKLSWTFSSSAVNPYFERRMGSQLPRYEKTPICITYYNIYDMMDAILEMLLFITLDFPSVKLELFLRFTLVSTISQEPCLLAS